MSAADDRRDPVLDDTAVDAAARTVPAHRGHQTVTDTGTGSAAGTGSLDTMLASASSEGGDGPDLAGKTFGRYRMLRRLGAGGMGEVWSALDPALDRKVAIKVLPAMAPDRRAHLEVRLRREAQALARLEHPHVVAVYDVGVAADSVFIAMQLVDGATLDRHLEAERPATARILAMFVEAARGLAAAHAAGIVHRDVKPSNLLVDGAGQVFVGDFGLARSAEGSDDDEGRDRDSLLSAEMTRIGAVMGTPRYMSPEQHAGQSATARSDQFSLCVSLWEALFGVHPFARVRWEPESALVAMAADRVVEPPRRAVSPRVIRALRRGLRHDPEARWPSMEALIAELTPRSRAAWIYGSAGVLATAGIVAAVVLIRPASDARPAAEPCQGLGAPVAAVWTPAARAAFTSRLTGIDPALGETFATRGAARVDSFAREWTDARVAACRAGVQGVQSPALLDASMRCLDRRLLDLQARLDMVAAIDNRKQLFRVEDLLEAIPSVEDCNREGRTRADMTPEDPEAAARYQKLVAEMAELHAAVDYGTGATYRERAVAIIEGAHQLGARQLEASARLQLGQALVDAGELDDGRRELEAALQLAGEVRDDYLATLIALRLLTFHSVERLDESAAESYGIMTQSLLASLDHPVLLEFRREDLMGSLRWSQRRFDEAIAHGERAVELAAATGRPLYLGNALTNLSTSYLDADRHPDAVAAQRRAIAAYQEGRGETSPAAAIAYYTLGITLSELKDPGAIAPLEQAGAIFAATRGPSHPWTARALVALAGARLHTGDLEGARRDAVAGLAATEATEAGKADGLVHALDVLAEIEIRIGNPAAALPLLDRADAAETDVGTLGGLAISRALALLALDRARDAEAAAARSLEQQGKDGNPTLLAWAGWLHGRARWELGHRADGLAEVERARAALIAIGSEGTVVLRDLDAWLASSGARSR